MILFTRRRKLEEFRAPSMYEKPLTLVSEVKYLGVTLDSKLSWAAHVDRLIKKSTATFWQLRRVVGKNWGLSPRILHWLYTAVVRPRLQYGAVVWWPSVGKVTVSIKLTKVQRLACLGITGVMRTTPTAALEVLLGLPTLPVWITREAMASFLRMRDTGSWKAKGRTVGHAAIALRVEGEIPISAFRVAEARDKIRMERQYNFTLPEKEEWEQETIRFPPNSLKCYTDGSRVADRYSGAGIYLEGKGVQQSFNLGRYTTVFQAEVFAILEVARKEEVRDCPEQKIYICSDSQAAIKAVCSPRTRSALVQECGDALEELARHKEVTLVWVPGHIGVPGNEKADELARLGAQEPCMGPEPFLGITRRQITSALNEWAQGTLKEHWRGNRGCRQARDFLAGPDSSKSAWLLSRGRGTLKQLIGVLTGHCRLKRHLSLIGIEDDPTCPNCGRGEETPLHFLGQCEAFGRLRHDVFGAGTLLKEEVCSLSWSNIMTFIRRSRRFDLAVGQGRQVR